jgi:hypothetical protein
MAAAEAIAVPPALLITALVIEGMGLKAAFVLFAVGNATYAVLTVTIPAARDLELHSTAPSATSG